jgi:hypothetical protein
MIDKFLAAIFAAIFGAIAYVLYPQDIYIFPISNLSLGDMLGLIGTAIFGILAIVLLFTLFAKGDDH